MSKFTKIMALSFILLGLSGCQIVKLEETSTQF